VDWDDFHKRILPEAERAVRKAGEAITLKTLFKAARLLGVFPWSSSTFRRCLGAKLGYYVARRVHRRMPGHDSYAAGLQDPSSS
jgi:hypothetical protein